MLKIKTMINVQKEVDVEIKLPYFCKIESGKVFYKVLDEAGNNIRVSIYSFKTEIEFSEIFYDNLIFAEGSTEIEESEFNEAFEHAIEILKNK